MGIGGTIKKLGDAGATPFGMRECLTHQKHVTLPHVLSHQIWLLWVK